jgi:hypothetical protein
MSEESITLKGIELAYARAIALIELSLLPLIESSYDSDGDMDNAVSSVIRKLERDGGLSSAPHWRYRVPLADLYDFSETQRALLLDLYDAGGVQTTRSCDIRYNSLGCGRGGKGAVLVTASDRWRVALTKRGEELVKGWI